jgi:hypothetical protein
MVIDKLFRMPPAKVRARDGSNRTITIEHRIGSALTYFTQENLLRRTGLEKEWSDSYKKLDSRLTNKKDLIEVTDAMWGQAKQKLRRMISSTKKFWNAFYAGQKVIVRSTFVPVDDKGTFGLFIQSLVDANTRALLVGEPEDLGLWNEVTAVREKAHVDNWNEAIMSAKQLLRLTTINKDLQNRMKLVASGDVPSSIMGLIGGPKHVEDEK